jgi:hypothetical protein
MELLNAKVHKNIHHQHTSRHYSSLSEENAKGFLELISRVLFLSPFTSKGNADIGWSWNLIWDVQTFPSRQMLG